MAKLRFLPNNTEATVAPGEAVFDAAWKADIGLQSACVGKGTCGLCRVIVREGEACLSDYNDIETKHLGNLYHLTKVRLACQCTVVQEGNIVLEIKTRTKKKPKPKPHSVVK